MRALFRKRHEHRIMFAIREFTCWYWAVCGDYIMGATMGCVIAAALYFSM